MLNAFQPRRGSAIGVACAVALASVAGSCLAAQPLFTTNRTLPSGQMLVGAYLPGEDSPADFASSGTAASTVRYLGSDYTIGVRFSADGSIVPLLGPTSSAFSLNIDIGGANRSGDTAGTYRYSASGFDEVASVPARWDRFGNVTPLATLHPTLPFRTNSDAATDISDTGIVTGFSLLNGVSATAVRWDAGSTAPTALPGVYAGATNSIFSSGQAVNNAGTVVGRSSAASDVPSVTLPSRATRWAAGGVTAVTLDPIYTGTSSEGIDYTATDINTAGTTIGDAKPRSSGFYTGVRWAADSTAGTLLQGFGTDANDRTYTRAMDINNAGTAVGTASIFDQSHVRLGNVATTWEAGSGVGVALAHLPGRTASSASAINDAGYIVGSDAGPGFPGHAVVWLPDGREIDLNALLDPGSNYVLTTAWSISDDNWISGAARYDPDGVPSANSIPTNFLIQLPEPASLASLGMIALMLGRRGR